MKQYVGDSAPDELPMLGKRGTVMDVSGEFMRVRIEGERWRANPVDGTILPAGTPIRVIAVNGLVLDVEAAADEGSAANENDATNGDDATAEELAGDG